MGSGRNLLQGYLYGPNQDRGLVIVAHGLGGGADSYLPQITYFVEQGWRVLAYDATGSFNSEGDSTRGFPQSLLDLNAALTYINTDPDYAGLPVLLFGHSWGGYAVANILHYEHEIAGVVVVSAPNSAMEMIVEQGRRMMGGFVYTQYPYLWLYQRFLFGEAASFRAVDAINGSAVPVLIIHGTEDEMVEYSGSAIIDNRNAISNPNVKIISIDEPGRNGHNDLYEVRQDFFAGVDRALVHDLTLELMDAIEAFFSQILSK